MNVKVRAGANINRAADALREQTYLSAYADASAPVICEVLDGEAAIIRATPVHPDDADELRSDLAARALAIWQNGR